MINVTREEDIFRGADFNDIFRDIGGGGGFNDIFRIFFGGGGFGGGGVDERTSRGQDLLYELEHNFGGGCERYSKRN